MVLGQRSVINISLKAGKKAIAGNAHMSIAQTTADR
jgi:hypothetical protein